MLLSRLTASYDGVDDEPAADFVAQISLITGRMATLETLDVSVPGPNAATSFDSLIDSRPCSVTKLHLDGAWLNPALATNGTEAPRDHVNTLRELSLTCITLGSNATQWLSSLASLEHLHLSDCKTEAGQTLHLGQVLQANRSSLQRLELLDNSFGPAGTEWWQGLMPFLRESNKCQVLLIDGITLPADVFAELLTLIARDASRITCLRLPMDCVQLEEPNQRSTRRTRTVNEC